MVPDTVSLTAQINALFETPELKNRLQDVQKALSHFAHHHTKDEFERFIKPWGNFNARMVTPILNGACGCFHISEEDMQEFFNILANQIAR
ncbi:hypothetical protein KGQ34_03070 [Patescibacteria group bacterium]|nr:hypothetical protein [Patescibacteria group bacterium]